MGPIWEGWEPVFPTQFQLLFNQVEDQYEARQIVKWYIHRLRRKVEPDPGKPRYILNVRGVGYRFEG